MDGQERQEIGKAREELAFELGRTPTDEEVIGFYQERYRDVLRMTKPTCSLHSRNRVTEEELINVVTDDDAIGLDADKHNTLLRLAIDDLMDSLKPKESLVVRQRFGLDGRGKLTLSEIAGKLNISQEMVRKYELKALMKLKHPRRRVECKGSEGADGGAAASSSPVRVESRGGGDDSPFHGRDWRRDMAHPPFLTR